MSRPEPVLRLVEPLPPEVLAMQDTIMGLEVTVRKQGYEIGRLSRELREEAESDELYALGRRLFDYHCKLTGHPRAEWTPARFRIVRAKLRKKDGLESCLRVLAGVLADDWKVKHHKTLWEHCYGSEKAWEEGLANCPESFRMPDGAS